MKQVRNKESLLIANASGEVREELSTALGGIFELIYVEGDERALIRAKRERPALILLESQENSERQFDLCQRIVREESLASTPVIMIVDQEGVQNMAEGFYKGAADYITKPLIPAELLVRIGGQLELAYASGMINQIQHRESEIHDKGATSPSHGYLDDKRRRILLVDDYPGNLNALCSALEGFYDVDTATNGEEAVEMALSEHYDLILLDVVMPEMDGYEVCRQLKQHDLTSDIPVIFLTGMMDAQDEVLGFELGAVDYIAKPYSLAVVLARVRNHLIAAKNQEELKSISYLDGLTAIPNRRHFDALLEKEYQRAIRENNEISLVLIDIDEFKRYNDHYGHLAGDDCLRKVSKALARCQHRASDFVARYGGEEFVAVLPNTDLNGAKHMAQSMLSTVTRMQLPHEASSGKPIVTISVGAVTCLPEVGSSATDLLKTADKMLYAAKSSGRNQFMAMHMSDGVAAL